MDGRVLCKRLLGEMRRKGDVEIVMVGKRRVFLLTRPSSKRKKSIATS